MKLKVCVSALALSMLGFIALTISAAENPVDATLASAAPRYVPRFADLVYNGTTAGDIAEADVRAVGTALQYTGLILNGDGVNPTAPHPFLKVQAQTGTGNFSNAACYLGNNGGSFGLGFFTLSQEFNSAHMRVSRSGSTVTIEFTNVNGGTLPNQTYVCTGAPAPVGDKIGVHGFAAATSTIDNFSDGVSVLDTFSFVGPLAASGNWTDAAPGMQANGSVATGGPLALSFWIGGGGSPCPVTIAVSDISDGRSILENLYRFRDEVMLQTAAGKRQVDIFYAHAYEGTSILLRNSGMRFKVALMLWRHQSTFRTLIQRQPVTVRSEDVKEIDALIGGFLEKAGPAFSADLRTIRQGLRDRSLLSQYGVRVTD